MRRWWTRWKRRENESTEIYYQFKAVVRYCVLIDWVGGPDGKVFGSRSWRTDRAQHRGPSAMTESQIFPIQPDITQSLSISSYDFQVLKISIFFLKYDAIDRRAQNNHKNVLQLILFLSVFELEQETYISSKNMTFVSIFTLCCYSFLATKADNVFNIFCTSALGPGGFFRTGSPFLGVLVT